MKTQNSRHTLECLTVQSAYKTRQEKFLHLVTFRDLNGSTYVAEELDANPVSRFLQGTMCTFEVTHPGKNGGYDWIKLEGIGAYVGNRSGAAATAPIVVPQPQPIQKGIILHEDLEIAKLAFQTAVQWGLRENWDEEKLFNQAYLFAGNIKRIAREIGQATDI